MLRRRPRLERLDGDLSLSLRQVKCCCTDLAYPLKFGEHFCMNLKPAGLAPSLLAGMLLVNAEINHNAKWGKTGAFRYLPLGNFVARRRTMRVEVAVESTPTSKPLQAPHITPKLVRHELNNQEVSAHIRQSRSIPVNSQSSTAPGLAPSNGTSAIGAKADSTNVESIAVPLTTLTGETAEETLEAGEERVTTREIIDLWTAHNKQNAMLKKSSKELKKTRTSLGRYLFELKSLLAKTGRSGRWTSFLQEAGIPRATADRYVESHKLSLNPENGKRLTEAISVTTEEEIKALAVKLAPRLLRVLTTPESVEKFLQEVAAVLQSPASAP
jgi:hypothetical protein